MNVFRFPGSCFGGDCLFAGWVLSVVRRGSIFFRRKSTTYFRYVQDVGFRIGNWGIHFRNWGNGRIIGQWHGHIGKYLLRVFTKLPQNIENVCRWFGSGSGNYVDFRV